MIALELLGVKVNVEIGLLGDRTVIYEIRLANLSKKKKRYRVSSAILNSRGELITSSSVVYVEPESVKSIVCTSDSPIKRDEDYTARVIAVPETEDEKIEINHKFRPNLG